MIKKETIMQRIIKYYVINICMLTLIYYGLFGNNTGALNVALFLTWAFSVMTCIYFSEKVIAAVIEDHPTNPAPDWVETLFSVLPIIAWAWHAYWLTATVTLISWVATAHLWGKRKKAKANPPA